MKRMALILLLFNLTFITIINGQKISDFLDDTYYGKCNNHTGTYFKVNELEIYITAKHLIIEDTVFCNFQLLINNQWIKKRGRVYEHPDLDIAVIWDEYIAIEEVIESLNFLVDTLEYGTDAIILGYPGDPKIYSAVEKRQYGQPQAFVKNGKICGTFGVNQTKYFATSISTSDGFSGGPVLILLKNGDTKLVGIHKGNLKNSIDSKETTGISLGSKLFGIDKLLMDYSKNE